jgi:hypothetical protein
MTIQRFFYCDLCQSNGSGEPLRGLYWQSQPTREYLVEKPPRETEHHICEKCLADLKTFTDKPKGDE